LSALAGDNARVLKPVLKSLITTAVFFAVAEAALRGTYAVRSSFVRLIPLPYAVGDDYGPIPPWLDRLLILVPDDALIWRNVPSVRRTYVDIFSPAWTDADRTALLRRFTPTLPAEFRRNPTWTIALNSGGYRSDEFERRKPASTFRIACVGDSWTFGMNVDQNQTYPARLAADMADAVQGKRVEVLNFGVLGYSSFQGLQLLKRRVLETEPDVVAIGFGMNDSEVAGYRDRDMLGSASPTRWRQSLELVKSSEVYKLLDYFALTLKFHPKSVGDYLREKAETHDAGGAVDYGTIEPWTRVSPPDFERNIREMIRLARGVHASVVLLDNELWDESPYRPILRAVSADSGVPLVDSLKIVSDARAHIERDLEESLHLHAHVASARAAVETVSASPQTTTVVFRVTAGDNAVPTALSIVGDDPELGNLAPNTVVMRDDGREGDERAGDGVWSLTTHLRAGRSIHYVYTNSGGRGRWEGLDVPHLRSLVVPASAGDGPAYLPIETFGRVYMQADDWHTDSHGYDLIARAVSRAILEGGTEKKY
jgi:lysophospholipase L1-like esterase